MKFKGIIPTVSFIAFILVWSPLLYAASITITNIKPDISKGGIEKVSIQLTSFLPPRTFAIEGKRPRIVCDFFDAHLKKGISKSIAVHGSFIQKVRVGIHTKPKRKVRVVLDLVPSQDYDVQQIFFREENIFTIIVQKKATQKE